MGENFTVTRDLLRKRGIKASSSLIVCKPCMVRRALVTAQAQWPQMRWLADPLPIAFAAYRGPDTPYEQLVPLMVDACAGMRSVAFRCLFRCRRLSGGPMSAWCRLAMTAL